MNPKAPESSAPSASLQGGPSALPASEAAIPAGIPSVPDHELLRRIGQGSYGEVWLARNVMGGYRAIKVVHRNTFEHDRPFEREFEGIKKFEPISRTHESQVDVLHVGRNDQAGYFYYVMELADDANENPKLKIRSPKEVTNLNSQLDAPIGPFEDSPFGIPSDFSLRNSDLYFPHTLKLELQRRGRLPLEECLQIGLALTTALNHLHKHGLVHRDVKPSNIIFVHGLPKLADIGLVASMDATMSFVGTAGYLPPEGPGTPQADIYSLGKVLYEICTGRDRQDFPALPAEWQEFVDHKAVLEFNAVLMKACATDARHRYQSAQEMHNDLALLEAGKSVRRLHAAERRLAMVTRVGLAAGIIAILALAAYFGAIKQAGRARKAERQVALQLYASDVNRAMHYYDRGDLSRAVELLDSHRPASSNLSEDLRSFEWFYLWRLCHNDAAVSTFQISTNGVSALGFSPDCSVLAARSETGPLFVYDIASRRQLAVLTNFWSEKADFSFSPSGRMLAYGTTTGKLSLWDLKKKQFTGSLAGGDHVMRCLAFSMDGKLLAAVSLGNNSISIWDTGSQLLLNTFNDMEGGDICGLAFSRDGRRLAVGHRDNLVSLWDASSRRRLGHCEVPMGFVGKLVFSPDNQSLAVAGNNSVVALCDIETGKVTGVLWGHEGFVNDFAYSPNGQTIATASDDKTIRVWDTKSLHQLTVIKGHFNRVLTVAFTEDGKSLASAGADGMVKLWETVEKSSADILLGHENWVRSVAFSPDGKTLASAGKDKTVKLWNPTTGELLATLRGHQRPVYRLAWSPDGNILATVSGLVMEGGGLGEVKLWNSSTRTERITLTNQQNSVLSVAFAPAGLTLATGNADGSVALWDVATCRMRSSWLAHSNQVQALAFSPDKNILASGGHDNMVRLWDWTTKRELVAFVGSHGNPPDFAIWSLTFSPGGDLLAVGNDDGTVIFWNIGTRKLLPGLKGDAGKIYSIAFTPDSKTLMTGTRDNAVTFWNLATRQEMAVVKQHQGFVESVALSPDGNILASASADKTIRLWRASKPSEVSSKR